MNSISILISSLSLVASGVTLWLTWLKRGTIKMTQPATIFFGPDGSPGGKDGDPKVYLRTLLYSTSRRGQIVESMFVRLRRGESVQAFNIWIYGGRGDSLVRGSGLYVGHEGVSYNHHFLLPKDGTQFEFLAGDYEIEVYAKLVNEVQSKMLWRLNVRMTGQQAEAMKNKEAGLYFDWGSDSKSYHSHLDYRPSKDNKEAEIFAGLAKVFKEK